MVITNLWKLNLNAFITAIEVEDASLYLFPSFFNLLLFPTFPFLNLQCFTLQNKFQ